MRSAAQNMQQPVRPAHPNEFDLKRIERMLEGRQRYRYVSPIIKAVSGGYRIEAPCCSRNIDPEGQIIDIALLHYEEMRSEWRLFRKDHARKSWELHSIFSGLNSLLDSLNADTGREFWQ